MNGEIRIRIRIGPIAPRVAECAMCVYLRECVTANRIDSWTELVGTSVIQQQPSQVSAGTQRYRPPGHTGWGGSVQRTKPLRSARLVQEGHTCM